MTVKSVRFRQVFGLLRVWFRQVFGLFRVRFRHVFGLLRVWIRQVSLYIIRTTDAEAEILTPSLQIILSISALDSSFPSSI